MSSGTGGTLGTVEGAENLVGLLRGFIGALPDLNAHEQDIVAQGDTVAVRFVVKATHQGELLGIASGGRRVHWDAVDVYRVRDGKISGGMGCRRHDRDPAPGGRVQAAVALLTTAR
jgi:predicted ester cyclase